VPITFATCCTMRLHPLAALLCSWFVLIDPLWIGLSRLHLNDMVQMLFIALTHLFALPACAPPPPPAGPPEAPSVQSPPLQTPFLALIATGLSLGAALQCKYAMALTTLAWLGLQNVLTLAHLVAVRRGAAALLKQMVIRGTLLLGLPLLLHLGLLAVHLHLLPNKGNGDGYMSEAFQATLVGNTHHAAAVAAGYAPPSFASLALEHLRTQFWYNRNMAILFPRGSHAFDTPWYTWPLAQRGVYFNLVKDWQALAASVSQPQAYGFFLHPHPYITLATAALAVLAALSLLWRLACTLRPWPMAHQARAATAGQLASALRPGGAGSLVVAYLLHWLPYATQQRQTFLFYYLPAYYFALLLSARIWHATACAWLRAPVALAATIALGLSAARVALQLSPIAYGSAVHLDEWTAALRLASTECWFGEPCWVDATK